MKDVSNIPRDKLLTAKEVADYLGVCVDTVRIMSNRGKLPFVRRMGRLHLFVSDGLRDWLAGKKAA